MDEQRRRIETWWATISEQSRQRMLALEPGDAAPEDLMPGLYTAGALAGTTWQGDAFMSMPSATLEAFLAERREG